MQRFTQAVHAIFLLLAFCWLRPAHAAPLESEHLQSLGRVDYFAWQPAKPDRTFHVFVDLPEDYANTDVHYPAVYLLDGGNTFPLVAAQHHYLRFGEETPRAILVGISYGADTFREGNLRQTDFTAPADERDFWGGATAFQAALVDGLIPKIEANYRADPQRRILFGHSLGGQFVLFSALTRPDIFHAHIASSPALSLNLPFFLAWHGGGDRPCADGGLFVSLGEREPPVLAQPIGQWIRHWQAAEWRPWRLETRILSGQTHFSAVPEALRQGLEWVFSDE